MIDYLELHKVPRAITVRVHVKAPGGRGLLLDMEWQLLYHLAQLTHSDHIDGCSEKRDQTRNEFFFSYTA